MFFRKSQGNSILRFRVNPAICSPECKIWTRIRTRYLSLRSLRGWCYCLGLRLKSSSQRQHRSKPPVETGGLEGVTLPLPIVGDLNLLCMQTGDCKQHLTWHMWGTGLVGRQIVHQASFFHTNRTKEGPPESHKCAM